jgi:hypothetical protein
VFTLLCALLANKRSKIENENDHEDEDDLGDGLNREVSLGDKQRTRTIGGTLPLIFFQQLCASAL